jgi:hypothetical protein
MMEKQERSRSTFDCCYTVDIDLNPPPTHRIEPRSNAILGNRVSKPRIKESAECPEMLDRV